MTRETASSSQKHNTSGLIDRAAPLAVIVLLIGGLLAPGGEHTLVYPAAFVCTPLILWTVVTRLPKLHWIIVFNLVVFGLLGIGILLAAPPTSEYGTQKLLYFVTLTLLSASAACLAESEDALVRLARTWVVAACYLAVVTLIATGVSERATPFDNNPIWVGRVFSAGILMLAWLWLTNRMRLRTTLWLTGLLLAGLFATGSRGPLLAVALGVAILLAVGGHGWRRVAVTSSFALALSAVMQLPLFQQSRITALASAGIFTDATRRSMAYSTIRLIQEHPLGVGIGNWSNYSVLSSAYRYPHNLFLEVAAEFGIVVGTLFVVLVLLVLATSLRRSRRNSSALLATAWLMVEIIHVSVSGDLNARTFFFVLALAFLALIRRDSRADKSDDTEAPRRIPDDCVHLAPGQAAS